MRTALLIFLSAACVCVSTSASNASLVLRIAQTDPAGGANLPLNANPAGVFSIFASSTVANQSFSGIEFIVSLSDATGNGGRMVAGTSPLFNNSSNNNGFVDGSFAGQGSTAAQFATLTLAAPVSLGSSEQLLATVTLSTVGAAAGNYTITMSSVFASDGAFFDLPVSSQSVLSTGYSTVPEPTSIALVCAAGMGLWGFRRRNMAK